MCRALKLKAFWQFNSNGDMFNQNGIDIFNDAGPSCKRTIILPGNGILNNPGARVETQILWHINLLTRFENFDINYIR